jgi:hypothetical protein
MRAQKTGCGAQSDSLGNEIGSIPSVSPFDKGGRGILNSTSLEFVLYESVFSTTVRNLIS